MIIVPIFRFRKISPFHFFKYVSVTFKNLPFVRERRMKGLNESTNEYIESAHYARHYRVLAHACKGSMEQQVFLDNPLPSSQLLKSRLYRRFEVLIIIRTVASHHQLEHVLLENKTSLYQVLKSHGVETKKVSQGARQHA